MDFLCFTVFNLIDFFSNFYSICCRLLLVSLLVSWRGSLVYGFWIIFFNTCIECYKFPPKYSFYLILPNWITWVFIKKKIPLEHSLTQFCFVFFLEVYIWELSSYLTSSFILLWSESVLCMTFIILHVFFMAQNVFSPLSVKRLYILLLDEPGYKCQLLPVDWWCWSVQLCPDWFSACWIYGFTDGGGGGWWLILDLSLYPFSSNGFGLL